MENRCYHFVTSTFAHTQIHNATVERNITKKKNRKHPLEYLKMMRLLCGVKWLPSIHLNSYSFNAPVCSTKAQNHFVQLGTNDTSEYFPDSHYDSNECNENIPFAASPLLPFENDDLEEKEDCCDSPQTEHEHHRPLQLFH